MTHLELLHSKAQHTKPKLSTGLAFEWLWILTEFSLLLRLQPVHTSQAQVQDTGQGEHFASCLE